MKINDPVKAYWESKFPVKPLGPSSNNIFYMEVTYGKKDKQKYNNHAHFHLTKNATK
jgi:hypothetical protein